MRIKPCHIHQVYDRASIKLYADNAISAQL